MILSHLAPPNIYKNKNWISDSTCFIFYVAWPLKLTLTVVACSSRLDSRLPGCWVIWLVCGPSPRIAEEKIFSRISPEEWENWYLIAFVRIQYPTSSHLISNLTFIAKLFYERSAHTIGFLEWCLPAFCENIFESCFSIAFSWKVMKLERNRYLWHIKTRRAEPRVSWSNFFPL